ncbi:unnamed protein product [Spirodela intermedia]|uniref:Uncharacterized protein n=1 Tax=Spirodela intermedia TaxID=51605 RepID=A0A7I8JD88_SPIIN|nr:unnamed protein product [Spirodela intermedia]CAA6667342.1 unnamed protein product [Spirodela intermedia]
MKLSETAKTILSRIQRIEPELDPQIIGYLLLKDYGDREMIRLSFGPDLALEPLINEAKDALSGSFSVPVNAPPEVHPNFASYPPTGSALFSGSAVRVAATPLWDPHIGLEPQIALPNLYLIHGDPSGEDNHGYCGKLLHGSYFQEDPAEGHPMAGSRRRSTSMPELSPRACHYYHRGYCKHGANCRYLHDQLTPGLTPPNSRELGDEDQVIPSWSLEKLELELVDLLKSKKGHPISIATLPSAYMERYGKMLQADGYLTESQRHGKAGFNLTRLLGRLKNSIRILDRPHGQHSVMLVEDALKYMEPGNANNGVGSNVSGSQQIYLTFPSDSSFEEDDVANYFRRFGRVIDVRIPTQHKRMFGFVTFESQETARMVLSEKNPHYICGSRVLVKPYKEKSRNSDRCLLSLFFLPLSIPRSLL